MDVAPPPPPLGPVQMGWLVEVAGEETGMAVSDRCDVGQRAGNLPAAGSDRPGDRTLLVVESPVANVVRLIRIGCQMGIEQIGLLLIRKLERDAPPVG